jgi:acetyl/propionyl-CoA carboxylase alpha subunit
MLKATGGGGGMGLQVCHNEEEISAAFKKVKSRGETLFNNSGVFLEKYYPESRHIEVQIFGNGTDVVHFGERECSIQRRHQKVSITSPDLCEVLNSSGYRRVPQSIRPKAASHAQEIDQMCNRLRSATQVQVSRHNRVSRR